MFLPGIILTKMQNDCGKVKKRECLNLNPFKGIQIVASVKIKTASSKLFSPASSPPSTPHKNIVQGNCLEKNSKDVADVKIYSCKLKRSYPPSLFLFSDGPPQEPLLWACNSHNKQMLLRLFLGIFFVRYFSREIGQFQSTWAHLGKDKTMRPHVTMWTSFRHVDISPCLWLQLVTEFPVGIWIRNKFQLKKIGLWKRHDRNMG